MEKHEIEKFVEDFRRIVLEFGKKWFGAAGESQVFLLKILNHARLVWRLHKDQRISTFLKTMFLWVPLLYFAFPMNLLPDVIPVVGLLDDFFLVAFTSLVFVHLVPYSIRQEHYEDILQLSSPANDSIERYRYAQEGRDLASGFIICLIALIVAGSGVGIVILGFFAFSYVMTMLTQSRLLSECVEITETQFPDVYAVYQDARSCLPHVKARILIQQSPQLNAYALGFHEPYSIVLHSALVEKLDTNELRSVLGHELGHILLNHMQLMSVVSASRNILANMVFLKWKRSCEYSCDAIGWMANGKDTKNAISGLIKISSGVMKTVDVEQFLKQTGDIEHTLGSLSDMLSDHPMIRKRVLHLLELEKQDKESES